MRKFMFIAILIFILILFIFIRPLIIVAPLNLNISKNEWKQDILVLRDQLPEKHVNLFFSISESEYYSLCDKLINDVSSLNSKQIIYRIMEIQAKVGDSHTIIKNYYNKSVLPFNLYWFDDGIYITSIDENYKDLLGYRIIKINNYQVDEIVEKVRDLIPYENDALLKDRVVDYLIDPDIMEYYGFMRENEVEILFQNKEGNFITKKVVANRKNNIRYVELLDYCITKPLYLQSKSNSWYYILSFGNILYFQYNICTPSFTSYSDKLLKLISKNKIMNLIIDIRRNEGGTYYTDKNFLNKLSRLQKQKDFNIYVAIGRKTFSSAILLALDLKKNTNCSFIGEATGGSPSHCGDARSLILPHSKLVITYSTKIFNSSNYVERTITPDIITENSIDNYIMGIDPIIQRIIK